MKSSNKYLKFFVYFFIVISCLCYLGYKSSYASYETNIKGSINPTIGKWKIFVNNVDATTSNKILDLDSSNFKWTCPSGGIRENKIAPGCTGTLDINIDASKTDVAVLYEFDILDKNVDDTKILKITNLEFSNPNFYKIDVSKYSGYLSLNDIKTNPILNIKIDVIWEDTGDIVYDDKYFTDDDNFITIDFLAKQYLGEEIIPYTE